MQPVDERATLPFPPAGAAVAGVLAWGAALTKSLAQGLLAIGYRLNRTLPKDGSEPMTAPLELATYTVATRPTPTAGMLIYVSDGAAGARFQGSHAGAWVNLG